MANIFTREIVRNMARWQEFFDYKFNRLDKTVDELKAKVELLEKKSEETEQKHDYKETKYA